MELFSKPDIASEILSRLPADSLMASKCTSKEWNNFISDPSFMRIHFEKVKGADRLFMYEIEYNSRKVQPVKLLTPTETEFEIKDNVLSFLPEKTFPILSCNGVLCCLTINVNPKGKNIYICNPLTRQWLPPLNFNGGYSLGLALYPFRSSLESASMFKLVKVNKPSKSNPDTYSFDIYSSDTNKWITSKEVCKFRSPVCVSKGVVFTNGWLHYLTKESQILAFNVEKELSKVIEPPIILDKVTISSCLGESQSDSYLHYVYSDQTKIQVWVLKSYDEDPAWELKYSISIAQLCEQHSNILLPVTYMWETLAFYDDVVIIMIVIGRDHKLVISYNYTTNKCVSVQQTQYYTVVLPYRTSLVNLREPVSFKLRRSARVRKRKLHQI